MKIKIPRIMSTQHPDNVSPPFFAHSPEMSGDDEIQEAYYAFSHLGCDEQMWDCEGKEVDIYVIRKLLSKFPHYFKKHHIGKDIFITLRVPNPTIEKGEAKILFETLESIPRSFDTARSFYQDDVPPIFEVILPMTTSWKCLNRIYHYYKDFVAGKEKNPLCPGDITVGEWIGEFKPKTINVIPLFEDKEHLLAAHEILREYLKDKKIPYQRVFLARSDPALNYGMISAVLLNKIALQRLWQLSEELNIPLYPILGVGSAPFRGNLRPENVRNICFEFPSVQTFTVQSAFKYDYPVERVISAIAKLKQTPRLQGWKIDEARCLEIIDKVSKSYHHLIEKLAPIINAVSKFVPKRRMRKLHIGLFGYSRTIGKTTLPRAISFCATCYSLGLPPEIFGFEALEEEDFAYLQEIYLDLRPTMETALSYFNEDIFDFLPSTIAPLVKRSLEAVDKHFEVAPDKEHQYLTSLILKSLQEGKNEVSSLIIEAAHIRRFLG